MKQKSISILKNLRHPNGLFSASKKNVSTGYNMAWIRDNVYECLGLEGFEDELITQTYQTMLDIFLKHEQKIDNAILNPPSNKQEYLHARYFPHNLEESREEWGNKQNDMIGAFLFKISDLTQKGFKIVRDRNDIRILQKLVKYLDSISYYRDPDNGMWEENEEIHSSSVGACVAGLKKLRETKFIMDEKEATVTTCELSATGGTDGIFNKKSKTNYKKRTNKNTNKKTTKIYVPEELIQKGMDTLEVLLPRESVTKRADLALLSLIWPYEIATKEQAKQILKNVEEDLVREKGVIRYIGDKYYNENGEAEWTMGFPWLAIIHKKIRNRKKYKFYLGRSLSCQNKLMEMPELYYANSRIHNQNSPLGWAQSLLIAALE